MSRKFSGAVTLLFIVLFLYTGLDKLLAHSQFSTQLRESPLIAPVSGILEWVVPLFELLTAMALCMERSRSAGLYASFVLMGIFTLYTIILYSEYYDVPCSCGGFLEQLPPAVHIILDLFLTVLAGAGLWITKILRNNRGYRKPDKRVGVNQFKV